MILPHRFFEQYYHHRRELFWERIACSSDECFNFWDSVKDSRFIAAHPVLNDRSTWRYTVPIGFHADAGAFAEHNSLYVFSWNGLLGVGKTIQQRFPFTVFRKSDMAPETLDDLMRVFSWSVNTLLSGMTPSVNWLDQPIDSTPYAFANGWRGCLCQARGDWQWYCEAFRFPQWNSAARMCFVCRASSTIPGIEWHDFSDHPGWEGTEWSHEDYCTYLRLAGYAIPVLFALCIGFRLECICIDHLHCVDLGVASIFSGNILWYYSTLRQAFGGANQAEQVANLANHLKSWYQRTRCTSRIQGQLTPARIRAQGDWPSLRAKAAHVRHLMPYILFVCQQFNDDSPHENLMLACAQLLCQYYDIIAMDTRFLTAAVQHTLSDCGRKFCKLYSLLARWAFNLDEMLFKVTPKFHLFRHLTSSQSRLWGNPRYWWCYSDEDLVGLLIDIAESCHVNTLAISTLYKWIWLSFDTEQ